MPISMIIVLLLKKNIFMNNKIIKNQNSELGMLKIPLLKLIKLQVVLKEI